LVKILITGSNGQLGSEFRAIAREHPHFRFIFTDVGELDITNSNRLDEFFRSEAPDVVINCAAYTAVDKAEDEPEKAIWINRDAVANLAGACSLYDTFMVHISTDYVFDGNSSRPYTENDIPSPTSVYGLSKLDGEESMQACLQKGLIIRTSWLYSSFGNNFVKTILRRCNQPSSLGIVTDQTGSPTYGRDLARAILNILPDAMASNELEILHYSNEGSCTWYELAQEIVKLSATGCRIHPILTKDFKSRAVRPVYSVLDNTKARKKYGLTIPGWKVSLKECITLLKESE